MLGFLDSIINIKKETRWLRYSILTLGEILLIIIGILVALKFEGYEKDTEDAERLEKRLDELKYELTSDIAKLRSQDSAYAILERNADLVNKAFFTATRVSDFKLLDTIRYFYWDDLFVSTSMYNELVNTGLIYKINSNALKHSIVNYYEEVESTRKFMWLVNESQLNIQGKNELLPYFYLRSIFHYTSLSGVDTTWIGNPKHPTFLAVAYHLNTNQYASNKERRRFFQSLIIKAEDILKNIEGVKKSQM